MRQCSRNYKKKIKMKDADRQTDGEIQYGKYLRLLRAASEIIHTYRHSMQLQFSTITKQEVVLNGTHLVWSRLLPIQVQAGKYNHNKTASAGLSV